MTYMVKYASKGERCGNALQNVIKTIVNTAQPEDNVVSAFRSAMIQSVGHRDIGKGKTCFPATTVNHHSNMSACLGFDCSRGIQKSHNRRLAAKADIAKLFCQSTPTGRTKLLSQLCTRSTTNFIEFCRRFCVVKGELRPIANPENTIVLTFPSFPNLPNSPNYYMFCRCFLVKYYPWDEAFKTILMDDIQVIPTWENFRRTASAELKKYFPMDLELQKRLDEAANAIEEEATEELNLDQL